ncbi:GGDEF domain-containing protein [Pseudoxanthomonas broegbernensis]|uniref:diguanylate cyclase n=1 Tax=Pseudoxanthomonas broegbernensis TaxID=83619 RepID=A0A7V8K6R1_9GAMM|nr:GGDEF domain-containing protein [Pseudoxanthomonas broegbernensis]
MLVQEAVETRQRARLGGWFYAVAAALAFAVTGLVPPYGMIGLPVVGGLLALACLRVLVPLPAAPGEREAARYLRAIWAVVLVTTLAWGAFSAWAQSALPDPAPLIALLFSGAFGMALAHTMCMRILPSMLTVLLVMLPTQGVLWRDVSMGVGAMWLVYTLYMLLVMRRSHREYRARIELEEELRHQRNLFERQSRLDGLTGLPNRREFSASLERARDMAADGRPLSLLILDIDHFKRINDSFGHVAGDACLQAFAGRLQAFFPCTDDALCARLGGEEFGVILALDGAAAHLRAEAFRQELARAELAFDGLREAVTVSIGCSGFDAARHGDADALYRHADAALYRAKVGGRNRSELAV